MIIDVTVILETSTATATAVNDIAVTIVLNDEVVNPEESFCERVDECLDIPTTNGNYVLKILNGVKSWIAESAGGAIWGSITGTLSDQIDLQNALNAKQDSLGYTPEDSANKTDVMSGNTTSSTKYLSVKGVYDWVISLGYQVALTAANFGSFLNGLTSKTTPVDADYLSIWDSVSQTAQKLSFSNLVSYLHSFFVRKKTNVVQTTVSGTSAITVMATIDLTGFFSAGDVFEWFTGLSKSAQTASDTWAIRVYLNSTAGLSGTPVQIAPGPRAYSNVNRSATLGRHSNVFIDNTTMESSGLTVSQADSDDTTAAQSNFLWQSFTVPDITGSLYLVVTAQHTGAVNTDIITHHLSYVKKL